MSDSERPAVPPEGSVRTLRPQETGVGPAHLQEARERDVPPLDPNMTPADLDLRIRRLVDETVAALLVIRDGPGEERMARSIALDDLLDELDDAVGMEDARRVPPAGAEGDPGER